jgi:hypothetical protein
VIPVVRQAEPADFDANVRQVGARWLREKLGEEHAPRRGRPVESVANLKSSDLKDYWTLALPDLRRLYQGVCAYAGIEILEGGETVDHFEPKGHCLADPTRHHRIYDWANYRYAFHRVNTAKGESRVIDPFEVGPGWFALEFAGLTVIPRDGLAPELTESVQASIRDLGLNKSWLVRLRTAYFDDWSCGLTRIDYLRRHAPSSHRRSSARASYPTPSPPSDSTRCADGHRIPQKFDREGRRAEGGLFHPMTDTFRGTFPPDDGCFEGQTETERVDAHHAGRRVLPCAHVRSRDRASPSARCTPVLRVPIGNLPRVHCHLPAAHLALPPTASVTPRTVARAPVCVVLAPRVDNRVSAVAFFVSPYHTP